MPQDLAMFSPSGRKCLGWTKYLEKTKRWWIPNTIRIIEWWIPIPNTMMDSLYILFQIDGLSNTYFLLFTKKKKIPSIFMVDFPATPLKINMEPEHHPVSKRESHKVQSPKQPIFWVPDVSFFQRVLPEIVWIIPSCWMYCWKWGSMIHVSDHPTMNPSLFELGWFHPLILTIASLIFHRTCPKTLPKTNS